MVEVSSTGLREAHAAGELLAASGTADAVDALITMVALPEDQLLTSDPGDLHALVMHRATPVIIVRE